MVSEATIEAYKAMTNEQGCASMKEQIRENMVRSCGTILRHIFFTEE